MILRKTADIVSALACLGLSASAHAIDASEYQARRAAVVKKLPPHAMLILMSPEETLRNGDQSYLFRQEDNLYYLTGINAPGTTLVLLSFDNSLRELLFATERDIAKEPWTGIIADYATLTKLSGIKEIVPNSKLETFLSAAFENKSFNDKKNINYYAPPAMPHFYKGMKEGKATVFLLFDRAISANKEASRFASQLREKYPELLFRDATPLIAPLRELKSSAELATIQRAIDITIEAQKAAMRRSKTATTENQLQATIEFTFRDLGADGPGYSSIVAAGMNATTLHYVLDNAKINADALVTCDVGAEVDHYSADVTITFPKNGTFSPSQKAIYEAVYRTNRAVIPLYKTGTTLRDIYEKSFVLIAKELHSLGLISKPDDKDQVKLYYMHGLGHPMGLAVHDIFDRERILEPSMVITAEPGIYVNAKRVMASETWKKMSESDRKRIEPALTRFDGIGVRLEDDILVTKGEPKNLSANLPRTVAEIEDFMAAN